MYRNIMYYVWLVKKKGSYNITRVRRPTPCGWLMSRRRSTHRIAISSNPARHTTRFRCEYRSACLRWIQQLLWRIFRNTIVKKSLKNHHRVKEIKIKPKNSEHNNIQYYTPENNTHTISDALATVFKFKLKSSVPDIDIILPSSQIGR